MSYALDNPQSEVAGWVIEKLYNLEQPDDFWSMRVATFSEQEKAAVRRFLHFEYESRAFARFRADSYDALVL